MFKIRWKERVSNHKDECHYLTRWTLETPLGSIRLHHWINSDDTRSLHDHSWNFIIIPLRGYYFDITEKGFSPHINYVIMPGRIYFRNAQHKHAVYLPESQIKRGGVWTLLFTGPVIRKWGFWADNNFVTKKEYFNKFGHHQCE